MDRAELFVVLAGLALIVFTLWFFFGKSRQPPSPPAASGDYACPMHPWIVSNDPTATCSLCGMPLVKR